MASTGRVETVYNMTVADDHTSFVGDADWGFALWARNRREKHWPTVKYILRGLNQWKNGTTSLKGLPQQPVKLDRKVHRALHKAFDAAYPKLRQRDGWENIYKQLNDGVTTPAKIFDAIENVTKQCLTGKKLDEALEVINKMRKLF